MLEAVTKTQSSAHNVVDVSTTCPVDNHDRLLKHSQLLPIELPAWWSLAPDCLVCISVCNIKLAIVYPSEGISKTSNEASTRSKLQIEVLSYTHDKSMLDKNLFQIEESRKQAVKVKDQKGSAKPEKAKLS
eukprot:5090817-Amphidinium_carterae.3